MQTVIRIDGRELGDMAAAFRELSDAAQMRVMYRALNKGGDKGATQIKRVLRDETGLPARRVARHLRKQRAFPGGLRYIIHARGDHTKITVGNFGARQTRKGVSHKAWNRRQTADSAFMAGRVAFKRLGRARLPIKALYGPNVAREMERGASGSVLTTVTAGVVIPEAIRLTDREIRRVKGKYGL